MSLPSAASAQTPLGPRLGSEITRAERDYFGLFPTVAAAFASATLEQTAAGVDVVVHRAGAPDTTLALDAAAALALSRFTETFEQSPEARLNPSWQVAAGAGAVRRLDPATPVLYVNPRTQVRARLRDGRGAVGGVVLTATDSLLTLAPAGELYRWDRTPVLRLRPADVEEVEFRPLGLERYRKSALVIGGLVGLAAASADLIAFDGGFRSVAVFTGSVAAGVTIADELYPRPPSPGPYPARLEALRERAAFRLRLPLDYRPTDAPPAQFATTVARRRGRVERWRRAYGWVNVALGSGSATAAPSGSYTDTIVNRRPLTQTTDILAATRRPRRASTSPCGRSRSSAPA